MRCDGGLQIAMGGEQNTEQIQATKGMMHEGLPMAELD
jgi:hypothetical protein